MTTRHSSKLHGVHTALFTPLLDNDPKHLNNSIDFVKLGQMIERLIEKGVQGVVPVGTTGQSATLSHKQHLEVVKFTLEKVAGRAQVIAGAGSNCTRESVEMIREIQSIADVPVLCVTGYYNNPTPNGILSHFKTLAEETNAKIVLYNVPGRTNSYMTPEVIIELAKIPNIIGLKQAVDFQPGGEHRQDTIQIIEATQDQDFAVLSGEDDSLCEMLKMGGQGIISATANIPEAAEIFLRIIQASQSEAWELAEASQANVADFVQAAFSRKNPIPMGTFFNSPLYQPLCKVDDTEGGAQLHQELMTLIEKRAPSLLQYYPES